MLVVSWLMLYENYIHTNTYWDHYVSVNLALISDWILSALGFETFLDYSRYNQVVFSIGENLSSGVAIGDRCNGIKLFGIFAAIIIALPKNHLYKLWYIPLGIFILHLANIIRVTVLTWIAKDHNQWLDFNHNVTFEIIVYSVMFGLWWFWINKFVTKK